MIKYSRKCTYLQVANTRDLRFNEESSDLVDEASNIVFVFIGFLVEMSFNTIYQNEEARKFYFRMQFRISSLRM